MTLALSVQAFLPKIAETAFEHGHKQVTLLFFVKSSDLGHGRDRPKLAGNRFRTAMHF
jgi:hypothetical protein